MAIIKVFSGKKNISVAINYVTDSKKTDNTLISGKDCVPTSCYDEMMSIKNYYDKKDGNTYFHFIQSFSPKDNISYEKAHEIGMKFAEQFKGFQVLVATHKDREHPHNHLVVNSVSFEDGKKFHMTKKDLERIKEYSNQLCIAEGLSIISNKKSQVKDVSKNELAVAQKGESWKFRLMSDIDNCMAISSSKEEFIKNMNKLQYQVTWTDTRKYITYTLLNGTKCRDRSLHDTKYLKEEMENGFKRVKGEQSSYAREYSQSVSREDQLLSGGRTSDESPISNGTRDNEHFNNHTKENSGGTRWTFKRQYSKKREFGKNDTGENTKSISGHQTRNQRGAEGQHYQIQMQNRNNSLLNGINAVSNILSTPQVNNAPKRKIKGFRDFSKQALKEYLIEQANASSIDWEEETEI